MNLVYLEAKGFSRDISVRSSRKEKDYIGLWKWLVPAYGLTESDRLWYLTPYEAFTQDFELNRSRYDPSLYYNIQEDETRVHVLQVDDFLQAATTEILSRFKSLLQAEFGIGSTESCKFDIIGAHLSENKS